MAEHERRLLKDGLGTAAIARLASNLSRVRGSFDGDRFIALASDGLDELELKERVAHVADALAATLHKSYPSALRHIVRAAARWDGGDESDPLRGFAAWPLFHFIETRGLEHFDESMGALCGMTHLFSSEFAVRPYIATDPLRAFALLHAWAADDSEHVRRLASEGSRPRLPWASRLPALVEDPAPVLALLEQLKDDDSAYVRRSVANNLNDIAKDHPDTVVALCKRWSKGASEERQWIIRRATRTLVKQAHPGVWALLGYTARPRVEIERLSLGTRRIVLGGHLDISFHLRSTARSAQRLVVDYAIHHVKANGTRTAKVFKLREVTVPAGESITLGKRHPIRRITTRRYHPGVHRVEVLVNGVARAGADFELVC